RPRGAGGSLPAAVTGAIGEALTRLRRLALQKPYQTAMYARVGSDLLSNRLRAACEFQPLRFSARLTDVLPELTAQATRDVSNPAIRAPAFLRGGAARL